MTADGFHSYSYDAEGNVTQVDSGSTSQYVYNALNQRVRTVENGVATEFVFNANGQRVSEWNPANQSQLQGQYYWGSTPVAYYDLTGTHFQHQDWLGTERLRTSYNGTTEGGFFSLPFGDALSASGTDGDAYHLAGLDHDSTSDTDHAQFRQYSPTQGRWLSADPDYGSYDIMNPQSFNRYAYVLNSPLAYVDPSGLKCDPIVIGDTLYCEAWGYPGGPAGGGGSPNKIAQGVSGTDGGTGNGGGPGGTGGGAPNAPNSGPTAPNNPKQPTSPVVKLICQQQARDFQAKYNAESKRNGNYWGNILGGGAGFVSDVKGVVLGIVYALEMNSAQSDTAYTVGYQACLAGGFPSAK